MMTFNVKPIIQSSKMDVKNDPVLPNANKSRNEQSPMSSFLFTFAQ